MNMMTDNEAEAGVIATLMCHPKFILHSDYLKPGFFYNVENGCMYWAISELYKAGVENIDALNISNMINSNKAVKKKISEYNISNIQEFIDLSQYAARNSLEEYKLLVRSVVTMAYKRDMNKSLMEIQSQCFNSELDLNKLNSLANSKLSGLTEKYLVTNEIEVFGEKLENMWNNLVAKRSEDGFCGIPSKFPLLNEYMTYEKTELVLLAARLKNGKSAWFMNEALFQLRHGIPVLYLDTEMSSDAFMLRALANLSGVSVRNIKTGRYGSEEEQKIKTSLEFLKKAPLVHMYLPQSSDDEIYSICKILKYKMDLQVVFYDYIKGNTQSSSELYNLLGQKTDFLKNQIAGELELAVVAGAQKNREGLIADSDKISRYCSTVIDWSPKTSEEIANDGGLQFGNFKMQIPTNRNGSQTGEDEYISMQFDGDIMRINQTKQPPKKPTPFG